MGRRDVLRSRPAGARPHVQQVGGPTVHCGRIRCSVLPDLAAGGRGDGPAAAAVPADRMGLHGGRRVRGRPAGQAALGRVRRVRRRRLPRSVAAGGAGRQRARLPRQLRLGAGRADRLSARPHRAHHGDRHRVLVVAGRTAPRVREHPRRRVRRGRRRWRGADADPAHACVDQQDGNAVAVRAVGALRRVSRRHRARRGVGGRAPQAPGPCAGRRRPDPRRHPRQRRQRRRAYQRNHRAQRGQPGRPDRAGPPPGRRRTRGRDLRRGTRNRYPAGRSDRGEGARRGVRPGR